MAKKQERQVKFADGTRSEAQMIVPASVSFTSENELRVENNYARSFVVNGYPSNVTTGWLNPLFAFDGDMDTAIHIEPADERTALDELTSKITQYEAQRMADIEKGSIKNLTMLNSKIQALYQQRSALEQNYENLFRVSTFCTMYNENKNDLDKESQKFVSRLAGRKIQVMPLFLRQDEGYLATSPFLKNPITDFARNMNTGALSTIFPFGIPEETHVGGTFIGRNPDRSTPVFVDFFNRKVLSNANIFISGIPGSGKSYFVSLLVLRSLLESVKHVIIDPEGEYKRLTSIVKGSWIKLAPKSENTLNPMDIDEEFQLDDNGDPTDVRWVDIKGKTSELLNLFGTMFPELIQDAGVKSDLSEAVMEVYRDFGITEKVDSLYAAPTFDEESGVYKHDHVFKKMPRFSDLKKKLIDKNKKRQSDKLTELIHAFNLYTEGGIYDMFDRETTVNMDAVNIPLITFDISGVEDEMLRPIAMQIALNWTWNKFMKKDLKRKKRIVCDEAWMLVKKSMAGSKYSAFFLENCSRRCRKYNGSLCVASQNFREFTASEEGQNVLSYSAVKFFMKQDVQDIGAVSDRFILTDGEKQFLLRANRGSTLLKMGATSSMLCDIVAFPFEDELITRKFLTESENKN